MSVTKTIVSGLYTAAVNYRGSGDRKPLQSGALRYAANRLRRTGERIRSIPDAILLLEQLADDPCADHCGTSPMCVEHEL